MSVYWNGGWRFGRCGCGITCGHYNVGPLIVWIPRLAR
jgi:hypothetical protein